MRAAGLTLKTPAPVRPQPAASRTPLWTVLGLTAIAGALRFAGIEAKSLWGDEIISLALSAGYSWYPWTGEETELFYSASHYRQQLSVAPGYFSQRLVALLHFSDQAPLYYVLLNFWLHLFGTSEAALRSLSLLASVASIPVLYALGRQVSGHAAGLHSAWILALAPFQVAFALFNRPYALLGFFALLSTLAAVRLSRGNAGLKWLVAYAVAVILGAYSHYLFVWNVVFQVPYVVFHQRRNRRFLGQFALGCLAAAGVSLLWAPIVAAQAHWSGEVGANSWFYWYSGAPTLWGTVVSLGHTVVKLLSVGTLTRLCDASGACGLETAMRGISYAVPLLLCGFVAWRMVEHYRDRLGPPGSRPAPWTFCVLWGGCVMAGPVIMDVLLNTHMVSAHRYFISASGPLYLAVGVALAGTRRALLRRSIAAAYLTFLLVSSGLYIQGSSATLMPEVGAREVAAHIDRQATGSDDLILVLDPGFSPLDYAYYLKSNPDFARLRVPEWRPSAPDLATQLRAITSARPRVRIWYIDERGFETGARARALEWLRTQFVEVDAREFINVGVYAFSPRPTVGGGSGDHTDVPRPGGHASLDPRRDPRPHAD